MLLSIILPIYNGGKTLPDLIDPILSVDRTDIEFILVDDGSKDNSYNLINDYAEKDKRVNAIHINNSGVSTARNTGLDVARGKYIYFCDCDDFVFVRTLKNILAMLENEDYDLVTADYEYMYLNSGESRKSNMELPAKATLDKKVIINYFISPLILRSGTGLASLWNKFFRLGVIRENGLSFDSLVHKGEDWQFILNFLRFAETAYYMPEVLYEYRLDGSQVESKYKKEPGAHLFFSVKLKMQLANEFNIAVDNDRLIRWCASIMSELIFSAKSDINNQKWQQTASDSFARLSAKKFLFLKSKEYLRLEIPRKYIIYSFLVFFGPKRFLRYFIKKTNRSKKWKSNRRSPGKSY